jgi:pyruvate dehydrogenase complex dehydrogenase (E1) component
MKKLLSLLAAFVLAAGFALNAQDKTILKVPEGTHFVKFAQSTTDVVDDSLATVEKIFDLSKKKKVQYYTIPVYVDSTSTSESDGVNDYQTILLQESFDNITYSNLDTVNYYGGADSTFNFQDISTGTSAPYLRVLFGTGTSDSLFIKVDDVWGRFLDK